MCSLDSNQEHQPPQSSRLIENSLRLGILICLVMEYRDVLSREDLNLGLSAADIEALIEFHCSVAIKHQIFFLWRPYLPDPKDDMVLELAVTAGCDSVITYNHRDFAGIEKFGIRAITPAEFLQEIGALP
jgi:predicted nucleic acid-binding protein